MSECEGCESMGNLLWFSISKLVHDNIECDGLVGFGKQCHLIVWDKCEVFEVVKLIHKGWRWKRICFIID